MTAPKVAGWLAEFSQGDVNIRARALYDRYFSMESGKERLEIVLAELEQQIGDTERAMRSLSDQTQAFADAVRDQRPDLTFPEP